MTVRTLRLRTRSSRLVAALVVVASSGAALAALDARAAQALNVIAANIDMAAADEGPICQDTGMPTFIVHTPVGVNQIAIKQVVREAVAEATRRGKLRHLFHGLAIPIACSREGGSVALRIESLHLNSMVQACHPIIAIIQIGCAEKVSGGRVAEGMAAGDGFDLAVRRG